MTLLRLNDHKPILRNLLRNVGFVVELHLVVGMTGGEHGRKVLTPGTPEKNHSPLCFGPSFALQVRRKHLTFPNTGFLFTHGLHFFFLHASWHLSLNLYNNSESRDSTDFCR